MSVPRVSHIQVFAFDALVPPALLRRVLAGLTGDVTFGVVAAVAFLAGDRVANVAVAVAFASDDNTRVTTYDRRNVK